MNADIIFVVSGGEIVEQGSHEDLLAKKGKYSELWSKQIFVKPKELKTSCPTDGAGEQQEPDSAKDQSTEEPSSDSATNQGTTSHSQITGTVPVTSADKSTTATRSRRPVPNTKLITTPPGKSPNGHKKEVDQSKNP
jgi:hypothetical protein